MSYVEKKVKKALKENEVKFEEMEHDPVYTSTEAAEARGLDSPKNGVKSLMFKTAEGKYIIVLTPGNEKVDEGKISDLEGTQKISLATPNEVKKVAGVKVGCVPPFGHRKSLKTFLNKKLLDRDFLYFNPGSHEKSIKMRGEDLIKVLDDPILF
ncbi:MAG: aminoacyl-tRNA deacylase [Candidatus Aenigmatarchaeota archaeon]